jgi:hypothetical protein
MEADARQVRHGILDGIAWDELRNPGYRRRHLLNGSEWLCEGNGGHEYPTVKKEKHGGTGGTAERRNGGTVALRRMRTERSVLTLSVVN